MILPVVALRPLLIDQQSSTESSFSTSNRCITRSGRGLELTVDVFISQILESKIHDLVRGSQDLALIHVAMEGVPGIPAQCRQLALECAHHEHLNRGKIHHEDLSQQLLSHTYHSIWPDKGVCQRKQAQEACHSRRLAQHLCRACRARERNRTIFLIYGIRSDVAGERG